MEYRNSKRSKKLIQEALITLLKRKKDISLISVTDIVKEAGLNRGTFYNHYSNISEVVTNIENVLISQLSKSFDEFEEHDNSISAFVLTLTSYLKKYEKEFEEIVCYVPTYKLENMKRRLYKEMESRFFNKNNANEDTLYTMYFLANGITGLYMDYFNHRLSMSLDQLGMYTIKTMEYLLKNFEVKISTNK